jgi:transcriptional regulator of acetoin/glycerol metabolism
MKGYAFPGNFRELETVLKRAVRQAVRAGGTMILPEDLCFEPLQLQTSSAVFALAMRKSTDGRREVLLRWNEKWGNYHFIGGQSDPTQDGDDLMKTIVREFKEKTGIGLQTDHIEKLGGIMETMGYSGTTGHRTWYRFQFVKVTDAAMIRACFQLANGSIQNSGLPAFVVASDTDIAKGFIRFRRISESVQECWQRLDAEGLL